jgi:hypothetical protein
VSSESEADSLCRCHLSFDCIQRPIGLAVCLPYPVEIVTSGIPIFKCTLNFILNVSTIFKVLMLFKCEAIF